MILGLDPATQCGWALYDEETDHLIASGVWDLSGRRFEGGGMRFVRLKIQLEESFQDIDRLYYEEVRHHLGVDAAHIYGGLVSVIQVHCEANKIAYAAIPVGTIKKFATGKGNAGKEAMLWAARERFPDKQIKDHNEADAIFIALAGAEGLA